MSQVDTALRIAAAAHSGQSDRDGEAYILHPLTVGLMGVTDEERAAGFLHDVIEDTPISADDLLQEGISESVVNALRLLTHDKNTPYLDYVQRIIDSNNPIALRVKFNDLTHNFSRGKAYPDLQKKHGAALKIVTEALAKRNKVSLYEPAAETEFAAFAGGCFWGVQHYFEREKGVIRTFVGYTGSKEDVPSYESVRAHKTGHVEAVLVEYDSSRVSYETLCKLFFEIHDPAQTEGQGPDKGSQYRSAVFFTSEKQKIVTEQLISILRERGDEVNTVLSPLSKFWIAEDLHQHYYERTGGSPYCHFRTHKFD